MEPIETHPNGFSSQKRAILLFLKRVYSPSLQEIAKELGISKVATLRHLEALERTGVVERLNVTHGVGRPAVHFRLRPESAALFPQAYTEMSLAALSYLEERLGRKAVVDVLERRSAEVRARYLARFAGKSLPEKVSELSKVREEGGYMAEKSAPRKGVYQLCEHNCPIMAIAEKYGEACDTERRLFEGWLGTGVEVTHRVVAGAPVCRFLIHGREER